jgi:DMSO/TMAO reductase YedYZ molybdopterin-dependent catalytic subunit
LISLTLIGLTYLGSQLAALPFIPFDLFDWMARVLPGAVVRFGVETIVSIVTALQLGPTDSTAKLSEHIIGIVQFIAAGLILGAILIVIKRRSQRPIKQIGALAGALVALAVFLIQASLGFAAGPIASLIWDAVLLVGAGWILGWLIQQADQTQAEVEPAANDLSRRQFLLRAIGGSLAVAISSIGLGSLFSRSEPASSAGPAPALGSSTSGAAASPSEAVLAARIAAAPGTRSELTSNENFYRIDINAFPPRVDANSWRLEVSGLVDKPLSLTLDDLRSRPAISQVVTLECISNRLGGDLTSTARFTGVRFKDILAEAGLKPNVQVAYITATDGFYESVIMSDMQDDRTLLVYEMNGVPLPIEHGFPLRIYIPNRFGMKQPKWIEKIELLDQNKPGYWVDRGWDEQAIVQTTSVIDAVMKDPALSADMRSAGGIAYAGARGISKVEVQIDNGAWTEAQLRNPPLSPLSWVQWRYDWPAQLGQHTLRVRAYDGTGTLQVLQAADVYPSGATGVDTLTVNI